MELSLFYFVFTLFILSSTADPIEFNNQCPTSRRLLLFGELSLPTEEKKSPHISSSSKLPSSPPKYARSTDSRGLIVYIRPQTSSERGHKGRSFTHLLKSKVYLDKDKPKFKRSTTEKKKQLKKKNSTQYKSPITTNTQELVPIDNEDLNRCRALLHIDTTKPDEKKMKRVKKDKPIKQVLPSKIKNATTHVAKTIKKKLVEATTTTNLPVSDKKIKATSKTNPNEKKTTKIPANKINENQLPTSPVDEILIKTSLPSQSTTNTKSKRSKTEETIPESFDTNEDINNSIVDRALNFVKNMFQLSDDLLNDNHAQEDHIIDITNEQQQQHHHHSRKLLTIDDNDVEMSMITYKNTNNYDIDLYHNIEQSIETPDNDLSFVVTSVSKRQLLSVKTNKQETPSKASNIKEKKSKSTMNADANKPKVGWAYRYRISRYLNAQKMKRTGHKNKVTGEGKTKHSKQQQQQQSNSQQNLKKSSSASNTKVSKRKLLVYDSNDDSNSGRNKISDPDIINSVSITEHFIPKRQLLASKTKDKDVESNTDDENDRHKTNARRRRMKSFEELTDPIAIVHSYDHGLHKPRVGWQFRYRVSRYIDSLRDNIHEDQQRLKLGLQAIKRKTPQELSGRRKRVLDKPFAPDSDQLKKQEEATIGVQENKPHVGWRYRYRISKMRAAKKRGDYIDDEEEKRKARREQKKKPSDRTKSRHDNNTSIERENELDTELRKINDQGRRVGWAYRYRIRRKLDDLKRQQADTGKPFDIATLSGKREKKVVSAKTKPTEKKTTESIEQKTGDKAKSVGWKYRYRVSKMRAAQKHEKSKVSTTKKPDRISVNEQLDPELARLTPEQRAVGWKYRYRIRRKLDSMKNAPTTENQSGKRAKKSSSSKRKDKIIKKVEESIEKILNIDDIDETPFMEYFRRGSSYVFFGLVPTAKKSICLLPLPVTFPFCNEGNNNQISTTAGKLKRKSIKKLKTKKEQRAKQFIRGRTTKLGADDKATERHVDETMKKLYKKPSLPPLQTPPSPPDGEKIQKKQRIHPPKRSDNNASVKRSNAEEYSIEKKVGVESKKNKKQFQIIGKELKVKRKQTSPSPVTTSPPSTVDVPTTTPSPPPRLRTLSEVIQEEASTILSTKRPSSRSPEETKAEVNEANEIIQERTRLKETTTTTTTLSTLIDSTTSGEDDNDLTTTDNNSKTTEENAKQSVHDTLDLENDRDSS